MTNPKITLVSHLTRWSEAVLIIREDSHAFYGINGLGKQETYPKPQWEISKTYEIVGSVQRYWQKTDA